MELKKYKALVVPYLDNELALVQDRRGYKPPPIGYFGGSIEKGETAEKAAVRELQEELELEIEESDLFKLGVFSDYFRQQFYAVRHAFALQLQVPLEELVLHEGRKIETVPLAELSDLMESPADKAIAKSLNDYLQDRENFSQRDVKL
jgi:8-oxo-dGTP pyrophosphatase MutT (NUDIX family)